MKGLIKAGSNELLSCTVVEIVFSQVMKDFGAPKQQTETVSVSSDRLNRFVAATISAQLETSDSVLSFPISTTKEKESNRFA